MAAVSAPQTHTVTIPETRAQVKTPVGSVLSVPITTDDTVMELLRRIECLEGISSNLLSLSLSGRPAVVALLSENGIETTLHTFYASSCYS
jgi:hypothetical protein